MKKPTGQSIKKLLIISYYWPPLGGPGSLRPLKFAKYLPAFGIKPFVITRKDVAYHSYDREIQEDVKGMEVLRTGSMDPARLLYILGMRKYNVSRWHGSIKCTINFPDNKTPWVPFAYSAARKTNFDYVFVTAPPFSAFITGYYIARSSGKPLIVDFRDAWLEFPFMPYRGRLQKEFVRNWERKIVEVARLIVVVDDNIKNSLLRRYPQIKEKIWVIPNGFDPDDFRQTEEPDRFTISYLGTVRAERDPECILKAIAQFMSQNRLDKDKIRFRFIGHIEEYFRKKIKKYSFVECTGHLSYKKAISTFCNSHVAVLVTTGSEYFFPSRQNEYLASGLPVIICGRSKGLHMMADAIGKGYPGWVFDFEDIGGMSRRIGDLYDGYSKGIVIKGKTPYQEYTRKNLTRMLAEKIKRI
ncbi:MAG: glycosyltransferase [candidate division WOR-3 bacterium]|nr:MAG: glycosyltransferase [candidate division WOR-3 bacterium]